MNQQQEEDMSTNPPAKAPSVKPTTYEISKYIPGSPANGQAAAQSPTKRPAWEPTGTITTTGGAQNAIRRYCEQQGDKFTGGLLRAVPVSNITELQAKVETRRQLTLGAP